MGIVIWIDDVTPERVELPQGHYLFEARGAREEYPMMISFASLR